MSPPSATPPDGAAALPPSLTAADTQLLFEAGKPAVAARLEAVTDAAGAEGLAWALRAACSERWSRDAACFTRASRLIGQLHAAHGGPVLLALQGWLQGNDDLLGQRFAAASERLEAAADTLAAQGHALAAAQARGTRLTALSMLGRHDEACAESERLIAGFETLGDRASAGRLRLNLGSMLLRQDRYADAARAYRMAAVRFARLKDPTHSVMADIGLALALTWQTDVEEAGRILARARARASRRGQTALLALAEINLGRLHLLRGRPDAALRVLESASRHADSAGTANLRLEVQRHLADAYLAVNLLPEAEALLQRALQTAHEAAAPVEEAWIVLRRAEVLWRYGTPTAVAGAKAALLAAHKTLGAGLHPVAAATLALLQARLALADNAAAEALAAARRAQAAFESARVRPLALEAAGVAAVAQGRLALAALVQVAADDAAGRQRCEGLAQHACGQLGAALQAVAADDVRARLAMELASLHRQRNDDVAAATALRVALHAIEAGQRRLPLDEFRVAYGEQAALADELQLDLLRRRGAPAIDLLQAQERGRARALVLALLEGEGLAAEPTTSTRAGADAETLAWRWLHTQWQDALAAGSTDEAQRLHAQLGQREAEASRRQRDAALRGVRQRGSTDDGPALDEAALHAALGPQGALVSYRFAAGALLACVVRSGSVHALWLDASGLAERVEALRFHLETPRLGEAALARHGPLLLQRARGHLEALHDRVWAPLAGLIEGANHVVVLPHGRLHDVPFAALHDGQGWLVQRLAISHAPNVRAWLALRKRRASQAAQGGHATVLAVGAGSGRLPGVAQELAAIATIAAGQGAQAHVLLDAQATLPAVQRHLPGAAVLHLACHGNFRADSPGFSALHLADGALTLHDVARHRLAAPLVTLSACESALSPASPGDERVGLVRGFFVAGAATVVASLWAVDDSSTAVLMAAFYRALASGLAPAQALRRAQCECLTRLPHPSRWSAFAVHGADT